MTSKFRSILLYQECMLYAGIYGIYFSLKSFWNKQTNKQTNNNKKKYDLYNNVLVKLLLCYSIHNFNLQKYNILLKIIWSIIFYSDLQMSFPLIAVIGQKRKLLMKCAAKFVACVILSIFSIYKNRTHF